MYDIFLYETQNSRLTLIHRVEIKSETKIKAWTGKKIEISLKKYNQCSVSVSFPFVTFNN